MLHRVQCSTLLGCHSLRSTTTLCHQLFSRRRPGHEQHRPVAISSSQNTATIPRKEKVRKPFSCNSPYCDSLNINRRVPRRISNASTSTAGSTAATASSARTPTRRLPSQDFSLWPHLIRPNSFDACPRVHHTGKTCRKERKHPDIGCDVNDKGIWRYRTDFAVGQVVPHITEKRP